ncbi:hypothetical protein, partial [Methylomonas koyamae]|uniref:hypothetical protein n=1 Tax=Methylomonas koyamae TaxID=702114 RepID=UPI00210F5183
ARPARRRQSARPRKVRAAEVDGASGAVGVMYRIVQRGIGVPAAGAELGSVNGHPGSNGCYSAG